MERTADLQPIRILTLAYVLVAVAVFAVLILTVDNGQLLRSFAGSLHELVHDGRHILGVPCH